MAEPLNELALALLTGQVRDMSYLSPDPEIENSVMFEPKPLLYDIPGVFDVGTDDAFIQPDDLLPYKALAKAGLIGLGLAGIKPIGKAAANYLPDAVKLAQGRVVEPIVGAADDAATVAISDMAREMATKQAYIDEFVPETFFHSTSANIDAFDIGKARGATPEAAFFARNPTVSSTYAPYKGGKTYPVKIRTKKPLTVYADGNNWQYIHPDSYVEYPDGTGDRLGELLGEEFASTNDLARYAKNNGYDALRIRDVRDPGPHQWDASQSVEVPTDVMAVFEPSNIRSIFAALDPAKRDSADLMAGVAPLLAPTALAAALSQFGTENQ